MKTAKTTNRSTKNTQQNYQLPDRALLGIEAPTQTAAKNFLQPLLTQNIHKLSSAPLLYSAYLTPQGRLIADLFLFMHPQNPNIICLDVAKPMLMPIAQKMNQATLGQKIHFHDFTQDATISATISEEGATASPSKTETTLTTPDPRHHSLGSRHYNFTPPTITSPLHQELQTYHAHRIKLGIPDVHYDAPPQKALPAEVGLEHLNAIDFNKGCYVGQEVTARLHFKSKAKKTLYHSPIRTPNSSAPPHILPTNNQPEDHTQPIIKAGTTAQIGWYGKPFNNQCLVVIQTRIAPKTLPNWQLTLPSYVPPAKVPEK